MDNTTYYQRNREIMLNRAKDYYEYDKERLREQARNKYRNLFEEDKKKKREYGKNRYHNMSEEKKQKLKEYQRKYQEAKIINKILVVNIEQPEAFYYLLPLIILFVLFFNKLFFTINVGFSLVIRAVI